MAAGAAASTLPVQLNLLSAPRINHSKMLLALRSPSVEPQNAGFCASRRLQAAGGLPGDNQPPNHGATDLLCAHRPGRGPGAHTGCGRRGNDGGLQASAQNRLAAYACAVGVASWHRAALQSRQGDDQVGSLAPGQGAVRSLPLPSVSIKMAAQRRFHSHVHVTFSALRRLSSASTCSSAACVVTSRPHLGAEVPNPSGRDAMASSDARTPSDATTARPVQISRLISCV